VIRDQMLAAHHCENLFPSVVLLTNFALIGLCISTALSATAQFDPMLVSTDRRCACNPCFLGKRSSRPNARPAPRTDIIADGVTHFTQDEAATAFASRLSITLTSSISLSSSPVIAGRKSA